MEQHTQSQKANGAFQIRNDKGLHTRPATELVKCSAKFRSRITLAHGDLVVNGKSLLGILAMAAGKGTIIEIEAIGPDAQEAVEAIVTLAEGGFHIRY